MELNWPNSLFKLDEAHHPMVSQLLTAAEWYVRALRGPERKPKSLGISGSPGCAKTHVAHKLYKFAQGYGPDILMAKRLAHWSAMWVDWSKIAEADDEDDFKDLLNQLETATFVVLDDVGAEADRFKNAVGGSRLRRVLTAIAKDKVWLVMTTNSSLKEMLRAYDVRVADRLRAFTWMEMGEIKSYRPKLVATI